MNTQKHTKRPSWAQTHHTKPKRYDRRTRQKLRAAKGAV